MLQQEKSDDCVIGTGESHSVEEFLREAFDYAGLDRTELVKIDQRYFRTTETETLVADPSKARKELGWDPKITFKELVRIMVDADMEAVGLSPRGEGKAILLRNGLNPLDRALFSHTFCGME